MVDYNSIYLRYLKKTVFLIIIIFNSNKAYCQEQNSKLIGVVEN